jgi:hypothetical protein
MIRILVAGVLALALPLTALATAVVESLTGTAQVADAPVTVGQKVVAPTTVTTGPGAQVFLRFDDGMQIVLGENSVLRVIDFRFTSSGVTNRAVFELQRGGARVVTGKVALTSPKQFFFRTPQTQLMVDRPADFTVALVNRLGHGDVGRRQHFCRRQQRGRSGGHLGIRAALERLLDAGQPEPRPGGAAGGRRRVGRECRGARRRGSNHLSMGHPRRGGGRRRRPGCRESGRQRPDPGGHAIASVA